MYCRTFHLTYHLNNAFNVRVGHMIVPIGLTNEHHEPVNFFGTVRPEGESTIIPSTWHETGIEIFGQFGKRWASFDYEVMVVEGLNANGFDRNNWVGEGRQGIFEEDNFTSPGYVARLNYRGVPGLRVGGSVYYCRNTGSNSDKPQTYNFDIPLFIWSVDAQYVNRWVIARGNLLGGHLGNSDQLSAKNRPDGEQYELVYPVYTITDWYANYGDTDDPIDPDELFCTVRIPLRHVGMGQMMAIDKDEIVALAAKSNYPEYGISGRCNMPATQGNSHMLRGKHLLFGLSGGINVESESESTNDSRLGGEFSLLFNRWYVAAEGYWLHVGFTKRQRIRRHPACHTQHHAGWRIGGDGARQSRRLGRQGRTGDNELSAQANHHVGKHRPR